jgi:hypothetical protein
MPTLTQSVESSQPVEQQVIPPAGVTPTSAPVFMAFVPQPNYGPPVMPVPSSPSWNTASWVTDDDGTWWASCLVGPELGGVVLTAGAYVIAIRVVDPAARPELFGWSLILS